MDSYSSFHMCALMGPSIEKKKEKKKASFIPFFSLIVMHGGLQESEKCMHQIVKGFTYEIQNFQKT